MSRKYINTKHFRHLILRVFKNYSFKKEIQGGMYNEDNWLWINNTER